MKKSLFVLFFICNSLFAQIYTVQTGETLSQILERAGLKPLYGKNGTVAKVSLINNLSDPNQIKVGQKILISDLDIKYDESESLDEEEVSYSYPVEDDIVEVQSFKVNVEFGTLSFISSSPTGQLKLYGGSNRLEIGYGASKGRYGSEFLLTGDYVKLAEDIDFPISSKSKFLFQAQMGVNYQFDYNEIHAGAGFKDIMGTLNTPSDGIQLKTSRSPYLAIGASQNLFGINLKLDSQFIFHSQRGSFEVKSGTKYVFQISKSVYESESIKVRPFIKHEKQSVKTRLTTDEDTRNLLGVEIGF